MDRDETGRIGEIFSGLRQANEEDKGMGQTDQMDCRVKEQRV
jgi:hypothetical protein